MPKQKSKPVHGLASTYANWGCRCTRCRAAWAKKTREDRARRAASLRGAA